MGDVILATALFAYLEKRFPGSTIDFVTDARYAELFKDDTRIRAVIGIDKKKDDACGGQLALMQWDKIIDLQNNARSRSLRKKLGFATVPGVFNKLHRNRWLLLLLRINAYGPFDSVASRYVRAAENSPQQRPEIPPVRMIITADHCQELPENVFSKGLIRPIVALIPFSAWKNKQWPERYFIFVGRYFLAKGWHVVILGGPDDREAAEGIKKGIGERASALAGKISLFQSACLLKRCGLALGNDTGLTHLARACGVKTAVVYGSTTEHFGFFPYGSPSYRIFQTELFCRPCHAHGGNFCFLGSRPCLTRTKPENVLRGLEELHISP
jgi:heptosyltransferase II